jgi:hypothetical protein
MLEILRIVGPFFTGLSVVFVASYFTRSMKKTDMVHAFDVRLDTIRNFHHELVKRTIAREVSKVSFDAADAADGHHYYRRFFRLQRDQFLAFQSGYIDKKIYVEWMTWRRHEYLGTEPDVLGVTYAAAWTAWSKRPPLERHIFIEFFDKVHNSTKPVKDVVHEYSPPWHRRMLPR